MCRLALHAKTESKALFEEHIKPFFADPDHKHVTDGMTFVSRGLQFKVIAVG